MTETPAKQAFAYTFLTADGLTDIVYADTLEGAATSLLIEINANMNMVLESDIGDTVKTQAMSVYGPVSMHLNKIIAFTMTHDGNVEVPSDSNIMCLTFFGQSDQFHTHMAARTAILGPADKVDAYWRRIDEKTPVRG